MAGPWVRREDINEVYRTAAQNDRRGYLHFTEEQNVSSDIIGLPRAATVIEGHETHTRSAELNVNIERFCKLPEGGAPKEQEPAQSQ